MKKMISEVWKLYRSVLSNPKDKDVKNVLADWLEDQGADCLARAYRYAAKMKMHPEYGDFWTNYKVFKTLPETIISEYRKNLTLIRTIKGRQCSHAFKILAIALKDL